MKFSGNSFKNKKETVVLVLRAASNAYSEPVLMNLFKR